MSVTVTSTTYQASVSETTVQVSVTLPGIQGAQGQTGATGATGAQGPSGVVSVTAPITNGGTASAANIGIDQSQLVVGQSQVTGLTTALSGKVATTDPRLTDSRTPTGTAGGDLAGTYPNPTVPAKLPAGGTTGQILKKNSATNYDTAWSDFASYMQPLVSGGYYRPLCNYANPGGAVFTLNTLYLTPLIVPNAVTLDQLGMTVGTFTSTASIRLGLFTEVNGAPSALIVETIVSATSTGAFPSAISQAIPAGRYWLGIVSQSGNVVSAGSTAANQQSASQRMNSTTTATIAFGFTYAGVSGTLASINGTGILTPGSLNTNAVLPVPWVHVA